MGSIPVGPTNIPIGNRTPFALAMPDKYKHGISDIAEVINLHLGLYSRGFFYCCCKQETDNENV